MATVAAAEFGRDKAAEPDYTNAECDRCREEMKVVMEKLKKTRDPNNKDEVVRELKATAQLHLDDTFGFVRDPAFKEEVKKHFGKHIKKNPAEVDFRDSYDETQLWNFAVLVVRLELEEKRCALALAVCKEMISQLGKDANATKLDLSSRGFKFEQLKALNIPSFGNKLTDLIVSYNVVEALPDDLFATFANLRTFECINNMITAVPPGISAAASLTKLDLRWNQLKQIDPAICGLANLEELWLSYNSISEVPPGIGKLKKVHTLVLDANPAPALPSEIGEMAELRVLAVNKMGSWTQAKEDAGITLTARKFDALPVQLGQCSKLEELYCMYNQVSGALPGEVLVPSLRQLHLAGNRIRDVPEALTRCVDLEFLDISKNPELVEFPLNLEALTKLDKEEKFLRDGTDQFDEIESPQDGAVGWDRVKWPGKDVL